MIVQAIASDASDLPDLYIGGAAWFSRSKRFHLSVGQTYIVYAMRFFRDTRIDFFICYDAFTYYPMHHPAPLFKIVDDRLSAHWRVKLFPDYDDRLALVAFGRLLTDKYFYDRLTDGDHSEVEEFMHYKRLIDAEFSEWADQDG
jgi:hypothetical protein